MKFLALLQKEFFTKKETDIIAPILIAQQKPEVKNWPWPMKTHSRCQFLSLTQ